MAEADFGMVQQFNNSSRLRCEAGVDRPIHEMIWFIRA
jgi:hypothetical protein